MIFELKSTSDIGIKKYVGTASGRALILFEIGICNILLILDPVSVWRKCLVVKMHVIMNSENYIR